MQLTGIISIFIRTQMIIHPLAIYSAIQIQTIAFPSSRPSWRYEEIHLDQVYTATALTGLATSLYMKMHSVMFSYKYYN